MPAGVVFEEADDSISWDKMQQVLSPQQNAHGCRRIVFEVVQRLKSRRYSTVLNTFTLLQTYSLNSGVQLRELLVSDHLLNTFTDIQNGRSNTLAAGLAQLLFDWKRMFGDTSLGRKYNDVYEAILPRAAPHIRASPQAEKYLLDPPDPDASFRTPLLPGFDFSLFNQKHRPAVPAHVPVQQSAPPTAPAVEYTSDNPTTGDSQPRTEGGGRPRSAHDIDGATRQREEIFSTAPAQVPGPAPSDQSGASVHHERANGAHGQLHRCSDEHAADPGQAYSQPSKAKARLGPSHAQGLPDAQGVPTETWDVTTNMSYADSCTPDQPMPDFKTGALDATSVGLADEHGTDAVLTHADEEPATTMNGVDDEDDLTPLDLPGGPTSIAELHKRLTDGFEGGTRTNSGIPALTSENKSVSTPLAPYQGGRNDDLSELTDSNCIQSATLPQHTPTQPSAAADAAEVDGATRMGESISRADAAPDAHTQQNGTAKPDSHTAEAATASEAADIVALPQNGRTIVVGEEVEARAMAKGRNSSGKGRSGFFPKDVAGAHTISWEENATRHIHGGKEGSIGKKKLSTALEPSDEKATNGGTEAAAERASQQQRTGSPSATPPAASAGPPPVAVDARYPVGPMPAAGQTHVDARYTAAGSDVPSAVSPVHMRKAGMVAVASGAGTPVVVVRPPKQITGASPKALRNGADAFGHAEPSPVPDAPEALQGPVRHAHTLMEALSSQADSIAQFTALVESAKRIKAPEQEQAYVTMGNAQIALHANLQLQMQKNLEDMRDQLSGASDVALKLSERWGLVKSKGKASWARWEQVVGPIVASAGLPTTLSAATPNSASAAEQGSSKDKSIQVTAALNGKSHGASGTDAELSGSIPEIRKLASTESRSSFDCKQQPLPIAANRFTFRQPSLRMHRDCGVNGRADVDWMVVEESRPQE